ncbi:hypothetical protein IAU60_004114 [Kwoniella sp. DSM 27419]
MSEQSQALRLGYIGLGSMGLPMAINLTKYISSNGLTPLSVWNRSTSKYDKLREGAPATYFAERMEELVGRCDVIFTSLINDQAAEEVFGKLFAAVKGGEGKGILFVDQSSLKALTTGKLADQAKEVGATYVASPVFGRPPAAEAAKLLIVLSGEDKVKQQIKSILVPALGDRSVDVGEDVKKASAIKSMGNMLLLGWIELLSEAYALGESVDIDSSVFNDLITQFIPAPPLLAYSNLIAKGEFPPGGFSIDGGMKDARNMLCLGADLGHPCPVPTIERALSNMQRAKEIAGADKDWSALSVAVREQAGLEPLGKPGQK